MKNLSQYIQEAYGDNVPEKMKKIAKQLKKEDWEALDTLVINKKDNSFYRMEEIEQFFYKGELKDKTDDWYDKISSILENGGLTPSKIIKRYSLATSGNQSKIETIAQVAYMLVTIYKEDA